MIEQEFEQYAVSRVESTATLSFMPAYAAREFDVDYGQRFHSDPLYRIKQIQKAEKGYFNKFGEYGLGNPDPAPDLSVGIQALDFMNAAMGGRQLFGSEESVWTPDQPLSHIKNMDDAKNLKDISWEDNTCYQDLWRQTEILLHDYPNDTVNAIQGVYRDGNNGENSFLTMHTPYTTAFRLLGDRILEYMLLEEQLALEVFEYIKRQYLNLWSAILKRTGWTGTKIHFGDCAATMLSPDMYESLLLPIYQSFMEQFTGCVIHSCGPSSHLLELFAQIPNVKQLQLGDGTNLKQARSLFPDSSIIAYYDPGRLIADKPVEIECKIWRMREALDNNFIISCGEADPDTPEENIVAFLETAQKLTADVKK